MACKQLVFGIAVLLVAVSSLPARDRFMWIPDSQGNLHLIDLLEPEIEDEAVPFFDGEKDVTLSLFTQNNPTTAQRISLNNNSAYPNFNAKHPTRFMLHGWNSDGNHFDSFRKAYIQTGKDFNIVIVDWSGPASNEYLTSKTNSRLVGEYLAQVIQHLAANNGLSLNDVSIIGHSLGAQAAGVAGNRLKGLVGKMVGLDAAAPLFGSTALENRLDSSDAKFVQCIHTNGGLLGWQDPLGHVDFFPNGGSIQPGCVDVTGSCSHGRSHTYYAESISSQNFVGALCDSYSAYQKGNCATNRHDAMGEWISSTARGTYYMKTNSKSPYGQGNTDLKSY